MESSEESAEPGPYDEVHTTEDIVIAVKDGVRKHSKILISFSLRFEEHLLQKLIETNVDYPQFNQIFDVLLENTDNNNGDIYFELADDIVNIIIEPLTEYIGEHIMSTKVNITLEMFDLFCDIVKDFAMFSIGETLLTSI